MILTGTPVPRAIDDIFTQFSFLDPDKNVLGDFSNFSGIIDVDESLNILKERISPFYYRIRKSDIVPKLPEPLFIREFVNMENGRVRTKGGDRILSLNPCPNQNSIYYAIARKIYEDLKKQEEELGVSWDDINQLRVWQRNRLIRLLEVSSNPALLLSEDLDLDTHPLASAGLPIYKKIMQYGKLGEVPIKLQRTLKIVKEELESNSKRKIIVWTSFIQNIKELRRMLADYEPSIVYGAIAKNEKENVYLNRVQQINNFKNSSQCRVLIANPASLAESVSLHKNQMGDPVCDTAIYVDRTFNGAHYMQSLDRIHRIGLTRNQKVRYFILITDDTVDLDVENSLDKKIKVMQSFLNDDIRKFSLESDYEDITDGTSDREDYGRVVNRLREYAEKGKFD